MTSLPPKSEPVLPKDDTQHNAELRQAFLKHLPRRIELVQKRAMRLARGAWDINLLGVLAQETQSLTGACGKYGLIEASEKLYNLELLLTDLLCDSAVPEAATRLRLEDLSGMLISSAEPAKPSIATVSDFVLEPAASSLPYPNRLPIPADFWRQFSAREVETLTSAGPLAGVQPPQSLQLGASASLRETRFDSFDSDALTLDVDLHLQKSTTGYHDPFAEALVANPMPVATPPSQVSPAASVPLSAGPSAPSLPAHWWPRWGMQRTSRMVGRWRPGWGWCHANTPAGANKTCWVSANGATRICAPC